MGEERPGGTMKIKDLLKKLNNPMLFGYATLGSTDKNREVIVQVFKSYHPELGMAQYEYHKIRTAGVLFFDGEFKVVIAAEPYDGMDEE
jgi:hypothetical protein